VRGVDLRLEVLALDASCWAFVRCLRVVSLLGIGACLSVTFEVRCLGAQEVHGRKGGRELVVWITASYAER
jgi:hypothetical protein